jgi:hypothetical protein
MCPHPEGVYRLPSQFGVPVDADIFLQGMDCTTLHPGIREAVDQALGCFRRGLYMPATVMLGAAVEVTWTECGSAISAKLAKPKLATDMNDPFKSIGTKVKEVRKALDTPGGQPILDVAGVKRGTLDEAELFTTTVRDRRNALHWSKARSFLAEHSDTANLLLAAPIHLKTLEAIRAACK